MLMARRNAPQDRSGFEIAILCALKIELDAVEGLLDEDYSQSYGISYGKAAEDPNSYTTGRMGNHCIVLAYLPGMGKANAVATASGLRTSFPAVRLALVVGVCGGAPKDGSGNDIFLGDAVISNGVHQIDFGRQFPNATAIKAVSEGNLGPSRPEIRSFIQKVSGHQARLRDRTSSYVREMCGMERFQQSRYPGRDNDRLHPSNHRHKHHERTFCAECDLCQTQEDPVCAEALQASCADLGCNNAGQICQRSQLPEPERPSIHIGPIASGDMVIKSAKHRDNYIRQTGAIAFEMEGAGTWEIVPTIVVKGVCDYANSHKNKLWQGYAAISAVACAKAVLEEWTCTVEALDGRPRDNTADAKEPDPKQLCLQSMGFDAMDARWNNIRPAHQETCNWLFDTAQFQGWLNRENLGEHNAVLWIKGKPGAGKSTLMKHALLHCKKLSEQPPAKKLIAAYFFNARGGPLEKTPNGMFRYLLWQLLDQSWSLFTKFEPRILDKKKKRGPDGEWPWALEELREFLFDAVNQGHLEPTYLFIDALDECEERDVRDLVSFFEDLSIAAMWAGVSVNICLSSRHYPSINMKRRLQIKVENEGEHDRDITTYIRDKLRISDHATEEQDLQSAIQEQLFRKANGIFMWVVLVVQLLNQAFEEGRITKVEEKLRNIPDDLDKVFRLILEKYSPYNSETVLMLQWTLFAQRPLRPEDLYFAVLSGVEPSALAPWNKAFTTRNIIKRYITTVSRGLVEISGYGDVQFIHETVSDFLLRSIRIQILAPTIGPDVHGHSHDRLAACCGTYMSIRSLQQAVPKARSPASIDSVVDQLFNKEGLTLDFSRVEAPFDIYPFLRYCAPHYLSHIRLADPKGLSSHSHFRKMLDPNFFHAWSRSNGFADGYTLAYISALAGQTYLLKSLLSETSIDINAPAGVHGSPLQAAACKRHIETVRLLLGSGAAVNQPSGRYGYALQAAVYAQDPEIVRLLLDAGADINARAGLYDETALDAAVIKRDPVIVRQLLDAGADFNAQGGFHGTALHVALSRPHENASTLVKMLLDEGASIDQEDLEQAARDKDRTVFRMLQEELARRRGKGEGLWSWLRGMFV